MRIFLNRFYALVLSLIFYTSYYFNFFFFFFFFLLFFFFFFNRHYNPSGFRPAQLSLSILSRKVFTECRCQLHVKPPTWRRTRDLERSNFHHKRPPASEATLANPAAVGGTMEEKWARILPKVATSTSLLGSFTCRKT
jgi:hypothetical protein